jgi:HAD superfamily hydrolase (TIGR01490 family)
VIRWKIAQVLHVRHEIVPFWPTNHLFHPNSDSGLGGVRLGAGTADSRAGAAPVSHQEAQPANVERSLSTRKLGAVIEAAFFDLDKTVIARASVVAFGVPLYRQGLISRRTVLRGLYGQLVYLYVGADEAKIARMRASMLELTKGWDQTRVQEIVEEALEQVVEPIIYAEALELITQHQREGRIVVIVSASPEEIVRPLARYLGADRAIASRARLDDAGRYSGEMEYDAFGPAKATAMQALAVELGIDLEASYAYSDSATDLPMLEAVGHPFAVNPDRELLRAAVEHDWEVLRFVRPVRLRDRVSMPGPGVTAVAGALAAATAGIVWWRISRRGATGSPGPAASHGQGSTGIRRAGQSTRSFLAARTPRVTRMARSRSFFMRPRLARGPEPRSGRRDRGPTSRRPPRRTAMTIRAAPR